MAPSYPVFPDSVAGTSLAFKFPEYCVLISGVYHILSCNGFNSFDMITLSASTQGGLQYSETLKLKRLCPLPYIIPVKRQI